MGPPASRGVPRAPRYSGAPSSVSSTVTGLSPSMVRHSNGSQQNQPPMSVSATPGRILVWATSAFARRYLRNRGFFLFLQVLRCFSSLCSLHYPIHSDSDTLSGGFPHSEILRSKLDTSSLRLIAGFHVFHRLLTPRHPPYALNSLITPTEGRHTSSLWG